MCNIQTEKQEFLIPTTHFELNQNFINAFAQILLQDVQRFDCLDWGKILAWHTNLVNDEKQHKIDGHNFNIFDVLYNELEISIKETGHSKLLKFLFDKNASHGQENAFLTLFLKKTGVQEPEKGYWNVTAESGRIDVMLTRENPLSVIIIENKSNWAVDQPNQLYRYWYEQIYLRTKRCDAEFYKQHENNFQVLYVPPQSFKHPEAHSLTKPDELKTEPNLPSKIPLEVKIHSFDNFIQEWLNECIKELKPENYRVRTYLEQYKELCNNL